jgi:hypothetical protein
MIEFPCSRCVEADHCKRDGLYVTCSALYAYKQRCRRRKLGLDDKVVYV